MGGAKRFVRVLQLLGEHPMSRVSRSIDACQREHLYSAEAVIQRTQSLAAIEATNQNAAVRREDETIPRVEVPLPDLSHFDQLLTRPTDEGLVSVFFA